MKELYNIKELYEVYGSYGDYWKSVDKTKYELDPSNFENIEFECDFCLGSGYYTTSIKCNNIFEIWCYRDGDSYITLFNTIKIKKPRCYLRDNSFHKLILKKKGKKIILIIDKNAEYDDKSDIKVNTFDVQLNIMSHDDKTRIKNMILKIDTPKKYLLKQNDQYYTIKSEVYKNSNYKSIAELEGKEILTEHDFETYGIDDLNFLTKTIDTQVVAGIDKGSLDSGRYFSINIANDFINISEVK
ncbi:hypothetical protein FDG09_06940 [Clostridium sporogenes]|uniref:hypothetical protein n=1 Tax=Clostridium sporogenes TaxID=1509 RepID=UPI0013D4B402|nr:hypothetical protein [Clostridium sporogenes]NFV12667.1 hypothetical protein [Clostridium sporogenes]